jgi:hypothetical protein
MMISPINGFMADSTEGGFSDSRRLRSLFSFSRACYCAFFSCCASTSDAAFSLAEVDGWDIFDQ